MRFISLLAAATLLSTSHVAASPVPAPTMTNTGPAAGLFTNAFNFCQDVQKKYGTLTKTTSAGGLMMRDAQPFIIDMGELEVRDVEKRATLSPALPLGRTYDVVPGSKGKVSNSVTYFPIGSPVGPCILFSFGGSYFNGLIMTADPFRVLFPAKLAQNNFNTGTKICQAMCDNFLRVQSLSAGGSAQCQSFNLWESSPPNGDPFQPLGNFYICDLFPYQLGVNSFGNPQFKVVNGIIANAQTKGLVGGLLGRGDEEN